MKSIYLLLLLPFVFISCSSDDDNNAEPENFFALKVGNSWNYNYYTRNSDTDEFTELKGTDEVSIISTEEIRGNLYYKFKTETIHVDGQFTSLIPSEGIRFTKLRDSTGYLIKDNGEIVFANNDSNELFLHDSGVSNDIIGIYGTLIEEPVIISVEAGDFESLDFRISAKDNASGEFLPAEAHFYFKEGIGFICTTEGYLNSTTKIHEKRLQSFSILITD